MLYATVRQRKIYVKSPVTVIQNGVNVDTLILDMDEEWREMTSIVCVFTNGEVAKQVLHTFGNPLTVPWECLASTGSLILSVTGFVGEEKVMTTAKSETGWNIVQNGTANGDASASPTPQLLQQVTAAAESANSAATAANNAATAATNAKNTLEQAAANGDFDGSTPEIGENGNWYINGEDTGKPSNGNDGKTPVIGVDYFTESDKQEIVDKVTAESKESLAAIKKAEEDFKATVAEATASVTAKGEEQVAAINAAAKTAQDELAALAASGRDEVTAAANAALQAIAAAQERALSDIASARTETLNAVQAAQDGATDEITSAKSAAVSAVSAEGEAQKGAVESAGTAQLEAINAAGSTQKQAVEAAGKAQTKAVNDAGAAQTKAVTDAGTAAMADVGAAKDSALEEINAAIPDIPALALDDSQIDGKGWSSRHIVDMLCPAIEEVGNPIQCYPVPGYPLDIVASWEPTQEGSGDTSPDNIRKIKGMDSVVVERCGENLLDISKCTVGGGAYGLVFAIKAGILTISGTSTTSDEGASFAVIYAPDTSLSGKGYAVTAFAEKGEITKAYGLRTETEDAIAVVMSLTEGQSVDVALRIVVSVDIPTAYAPYQGKTLHLVSPKTVYGGKIAADGTGHRTWGYIASYAGETLPGEWISDRDVYVEGTAPTIGAEVAYRLAEPIPFTATGGATLPALDGINTILTDADSVTVKARADPNHVITELQDALASITETKEG